MKNNAIFLSLIAFMCFLFNNNEACAQIVCPVKLKGEAQVKIFIVKLKGEADLVAYNCDTPGEAVGNNGLWYVTTSKGQANKTYFVVDYPGEADIKIYITELKGEAGWINKSKMHFML